MRLDNATNDASLTIERMPRDLVGFARIPSTRNDGLEICGTRFPRSEYTFGGNRL